jgi:hypothetical protein
VALDPSDPLLRSYLGKAYFEEGSYHYRVIRLAACVVAGSLAGSKDIAEGGA